MAAPFPLAFRCDGSAEVGFGHVARCLALAADSGCRCQFIGPFDRDVEEQIVNAGHAADVVAEWKEGDLGRTIPAGHDAGSVIVTDSHRLDGRYYSALRAAALRVMAFADFPATRYDVDVLVNPNAGAARMGHEVVPGAMVLTGPAYLPLRPAFATRARAAQPPRERVGTVLVSLGGWIDLNVARLVIEGLRPWAEGAQATVVFVAGLAAPLSEVEAIRQMLGPAGRVVVAPPDPGALAADADLAIVNGSVAAYEAAALGVPLIAMSVSANQDAAVAALGAEGAAVSMGSAGEASSGRIRKAVEALAGDRAAREALSAAARRLVDGDGAARLSVILRNLARVGRDAVRPAPAGGAA